MNLRAFAAALALWAGAFGCELNPEGGMGGDDPGLGGGGTTSQGGSSGSPAGSGGSLGGSGGSLGGSGGSASPGGSGGAGGGSVTYGPIWGAASDSIDITWFSFFGGGARFVKTREELTAEELAIVAGMATIPADDDICVEDAGEARVVVYSNSVPDLYYASQYDGSCGRAVRLVAYEPVHALLELVGCKTAKAYDGSTLETAASITPNDGCYHGIFNSSDATPKWWFVLVVPTAGTLSVMLDSCGDRDLELTLFDETGETALATTTSAMNAAGAECPELTLDVEPGNYAVYVDMRGGTYAGDFYIRTESH